MQNKRVLEISICLYWMFSDFFELYGFGTIAQLEHWDAAAHVEKVN